VYLLVLYAYIKEMHCSRSTIPSKKSHPYIYIYIYVKFLALLGAPFICDISRLRVNIRSSTAICPPCMRMKHLSGLAGEDKTPCHWRTSNSDPPARGNT
jgi:hypothetical protein